MVICFCHCHLKLNGVQCIPNHSGRMLGISCQRGCSMWMLSLSDLMSRLAHVER